MKYIGKIPTRDTEPLVENQASISRFTPDRDSVGVRMMFFTLMEYALPSLTPKDIRYCWHICRGITTAHNLTTLMGRTHQGVNSDLYLLRKKLKVPSQESLVRAVWGLYALAWGKPIVKERADGNN